MPKIIKDYDFNTRGGRTMYPWEDWFDGKIRAFVEGDDFTVKPTSFRSAFVGAASRAGLKTQTTVEVGDDDKTTVYARAFEPETTAENNGD